MINGGNADDLAILANILAQTKPQLHSLEQAARDIGLYVNAIKTELMCFNQGAIPALSGKPLGYKSAAKTHLQKPMYLSISLSLSLSLYIYIYIYVCVCVCACVCVLMD